MSITAHFVVKNEEIWIWYAIMAVIDHVDKILIYDTGSKDNTIPIIETIKSDKIELIRRGELQEGKDFYDLFTDWKNELVHMTKTDYWCVIDADEIYSTSGFKLMIDLLPSLPKQYTTMASKMKFFVENMHRVSAENVTWRYAFVRTGEHFWTLGYGDEVLVPRPTINQRLSHWYNQEGWEFDCFHTTFLKRTYLEYDDTYQRAHRKLRSEVGKLYTGMYGYSGPYPEVFYRKDVPEIVKNPYIEQIYKPKEEFGM